MKWFKKITRILVLTGLVLFSSLFIYANWNSPRLAHQAKPAYYAAFDLQGTCSEEQKSVLEKELALQKGVNALSINTKSKLAVIAYNPDEVDDPAVFVSLINKTATVKATPKKWEIDPDKPQCPAHGFLAWLDNVKSVLCIRNK